MKKVICIILTLLLAASLVVTIAACSSRPTQEFASAEEWDNAWTNTISIIDPIHNTSEISVYTINCDGKMLGTDGSDYGEGHIRLIVDMENLKMYSHINLEQLMPNAPYEEIDEERYVEVVDNVVYLYIKVSAKNVSSPSFQPYPSYPNFQPNEWNAYKHEINSQDQEEIKMMFSEMVLQSILPVSPSRAGSREFEDYELKDGYYVYEDNSSDDTIVTKLKFYDNKLTYMYIENTDSEEGTREVYEYNYSGSVSIPASIQDMRDSAQSASF